MIKTENEALCLGATSGPEDVAVRNMPSPEMLTRTVPAATSVNISNSSRVHVGSLFVTITQNVKDTNTELNARRKLTRKWQCCVLASPASAKARRLGCTVVLCLCWIFVFVLGLGLYLKLNQSGIEYDRLDIGLKETWYVPREEWHAMTPYSVDLLDLPVEIVIIGPSDLEYCYEMFDCIRTLINAQSYSFSTGHLDILPNFLVGGNGTIFEGRGANVRGEIMKSWDTKIISIMFIGDYGSLDQNLFKLKHLNIFLEQLVQKGVLIRNFSLFGQCRVFIEPNEVLLSPLDSTLLKHFKEFLRAANIGCVYI